MSKAREILLVLNYMLPALAIILNGAVIHEFQTLTTKLKFGVIGRELEEVAKNQEERMPHYNPYRH